MNNKPMKILIIEDDKDDCSNFIKSIEKRQDFELIDITDSDLEAIKYVRFKHPEGIVLDIELNDSTSGNMDALEFLDEIKKLKLNYQPIIIVTTHIKSKRVYDILHKNGVDIILYKDHPKYTSDYVLNKFLSLREISPVSSINKLKEDNLSNEKKISDQIKHELELIGITSNLVGRKYIHDGIMYLIQNDDGNGLSVIQYLKKIYKRPESTINNGIQNAIVHGWRVSSLEDLEINYTAKISHETGIPTAMQLIYYYADKIKNKI